VRIGLHTLVAGLACLVWLLVPLAAAEAPTEIGPGASREEVIRAFGKPVGESRLGPREVLNYPQGQTVILENGRVTRIQSPKKSGAALVTAAPPPPHPWRTDFAAALEEAQRRGVRVLALFPGPEDAPSARRFMTEVAPDPDFASVFGPDFVFVRFDHAVRPPQPAAWQERNDRLRTDWGVLGFPTVVFVSERGERLGSIDFAGVPAGEALKPRVIASLRGLRGKLALSAAEPAAPATASPETTSPLVLDRLTPFALRVGLRSAEDLVEIAFLGGLLASGLMVWMLWRTRVPPEAVRSHNHARRISEAASGLPSVQEVLAWNKDQLCHAAMLLGESEGYEPVRTPGETDKDVVLTRRGETYPAVVVCCSPARAGTITTKSVRGLVGTAAAEQAPLGWYLAPAGCSEDARDFAARNNILILDATGLIARMRDMPPILLPKLQTNKPW
jgi:hypothetical protein